LIDEVQKAPELFEYIKLICDESEDTGLFWLTGSESKKLLRQSGDSLAGRICILKMYSLSQREKEGMVDIGNIDYSFEGLRGRQEVFKNQKEIDLIVEEGGTLHPIEIKKSTNPEKKVIKTFDVLKTTSNLLGNGLVACMTDQVFPLNECNFMIPSNII
jgi:hypothetical protein